MTRIVIGSLMCVVVAATAAGQNQKARTPDELDAGVVWLAYRTAEPLHGGRVIYAEGTASAAREDRFGLQGLAVTQPVVVSVIPKDPAVRLQLAVRRPGVDRVGRQADTGTPGIATVTFRTQGEAHIHVRAAAGASPYQVMVWVGPEIRPALAPPFRAVKAEVLKTGKDATR